MHNIFQNQEKVDAFKDMHDRKLHIKLDHPKRTTMHITRAHGME